MGVRDNGDFFSTEFFSILTPLSSAILKFDDDWLSYKFIGLARFLQGLISNPELFLLECGAGAQAFNHPLRYYKLRQSLTAVLDSSRIYNSIASTNELIQNIVLGSIICFGRVSSSSGLKSTRIIRNRVALEPSGMIQMKR